MNDLLKRKLKKNVLVFFIFLTILLLLITFFMLDFLKVDILKTSLEQAMLSSQLASEYKSMNNIKVIKSPNDCVFPVVFEGSCEGNRIIIPIVRMTGKYGVHMGFFMYDTKKEDVVFSGLLIEDSSKDTRQYGISQGIIDHWQRKIKLIMKNL